MRKILERCPSCGGDLEVTRLNCTRCETVILGRYEPCRFCRLSPENVQFLESFIKSRGNVKEMERELGISYWTIRSQLNALIQELGFEETGTGGDVAAQRREVLERLSRKEITASEAAEILARL